jgi:hypothetical protein
VHEDFDELPEFCGDRDVEIVSSGSEEQYSRLLMSFLHVDSNRVFRARDL